MRKSFSRVLFLCGVLGFILSEIVSFFASINQPPDSFNGTFLIVGALLAIIGAVLIGIGWIGALVKTAQLARWGWFVCLLLFGPVTMFGYIFVGPTIPVVARNG